MRKAMMAALAAATLVVQGCSSPLGGLGRYEVTGVEEGDMLKLRGGPGTGFDVLFGLPNGAVVNVHSCQSTGATRWCEVTPDRGPGLRGHVSQAYLRKL